MSARLTDQATSLPAHYVRHIAEQLRSRGVSVEGWLGRARLTEAKLDDPGLTLPYGAFRELVLGALAATNEPALGLFVGARLVASSHGIVGYAAQMSGTLGDALGILERFTGLRTTLLSISHARGGADVRVAFVETEPLADIQRPVLEAVILSIKNVLDTISLGACRVREVAFPFDAPDYARLANELFGCPVRYGQAWAGLTLPAEVIDVPLKLADPGAFREASLICQRELDKLAANESLSARVRRLLFEKQSGFPSLETTARLLHLTPRTLHRHLLDEGTSYRALLEEVRHTLAVEHLKAGRFSIEEIAYVLGYSDLANFRRAFKRWESVPPSAYAPRTAGKRARRT